MKKLYFMVWAVILSTAFMACTEDKNDPKGNDKKGLNYNFTIAEGETEYKFEVNGEAYTGYPLVLNSLNKSKYLAINFEGQFPYGGISWLPKETGTFKGGDLLGDGTGSTTRCFV